MNPNPPLENLKPWKPGESGNSGGRPAGSLSMTAILRRKLSAGDAKAAEELVDKWIESAKAGNSHNLQQIIDRIDGKVSDHLTLDFGESLREMERTFNVIIAAIEPFTDAREAVVKALRDMQRVGVEREDLAAAGPELTSNGRGPAP